MLGLTLSDLYPCEAWSFTFGTFLPGHGESGGLQSHSWAGTAPWTWLILGHGRRGWVGWGRPPLTPLPSSPEVGICSLARFAGEFPQAGPSAPDLTPVEAAVDSPEAPLQDGGQRLCFSALGVVQCCKVGMGTGGHRRARRSHKPSAWSVFTTRGQVPAVQIEETEAQRCHMAVRPQTGL